MLSIYIIDVVVIKKHEEAIIMHGVYVDGLTEHPYPIFSPQMPNNSFHSLNMIVNLDSNIFQLVLQSSIVEFEIHEYLDYFEWIHSLFRSVSLSAGSWLQD